MNTTTKKWTTVNIPELTGKVIIVTGGNSGLGYESVKTFSEKGAEVISACRSIEKGENAKSEIMKSYPDAKIEVEELDLMDLESVKNFAFSFSKKYNRLDILMNNAGIMTTPYFLTKDGFEGQMGTNHLGHFALTGRLIHRIINTPGSRIVNVSSNAHKAGKIDFGNLLFENGKDYSPLKAYGRSKLANLLFTYELQRRFEKKGIESISVAAHPGYSQTNLARYLENKLLFRLFNPVAKLIAQNAAMGALPQIRAATDPSVKGGEYYGPGGNNQLKGFPVRVDSNKASHSLDDAKKLWNESEKLTGVEFSL